MKKRQADFVRKYMRELRHALPINYPNQKKNSAFNKTKPD